MPCNSASTKMIIIIVIVSYGLRCKRDSFVAGTTQDVARGGNLFFAASFVSADEKSLDVLAQNDNVVVTDRAKHKSSNGDEEERQRRSGNFCLRCRKSTNLEKLFLDLKV